VLLAQAQAAVARLQASIAVCNNQRNVMEKEQHTLLHEMEAAQSNEERAAVYAQMQVRCERAS